MPHKSPSQKVTSTRVAKQASKVLRNPRQDVPSKSSAGSALSQKPPKKELRSDVLPALW